MEQLAQPVLEQTLAVVLELVDDVEEDLERVDVIEDELEECESVDVVIDVIEDDRDSVDVGIVEFEDVEDTEMLEILDRDVEEVDGLMVDEMLCEVDEALLV
jgi:hypothetical protein